MLNRRYLRVKVFQSLYAYGQADDASTARLEKELIKGIERVHDLYLSLLLVFGELRHVAELRQEDRLKKKLPTAEDLKPSKRFIDNPILTAITGNERLRLEAEKRRISWVGNHDVFTSMYKEMEATPEFQAYLGATGGTFNQDRDLLVWLLTEQIANNEGLQDVFETRSIYWMEDMDLAATLVKRALEQLRGPATADLEVPGLDRDPAEENAFVGLLFRKTIEQDAEHEVLIAEKASNWEADRIAVSDMILMKMALTEVRVFEQIPVKVTLNEYIEIAKAYSTPKSKNFINGVLDKLFLEMKADGRIQKVGRGLLES